MDHPTARLRKKFVHNDLGGDMLSAPFERTSSSCTHPLGTPRAHIPHHPPIARPSTTAELRRYNTRRPGAVDAIPPSNRFRYVAATLLPTADLDLREDLRARRSACSSSPALAYVRRSAASSLRLFCQRSKLLQAVGATDVNDSESIRSGVRAIGKNLFYFGSRPPPALPNRRICIWNCICAAYLRHPRCNDSVPGVFHASLCCFLGT
ncbi:hypothetical protein B0H19DRAFT_90735 [Mycena capillaripes]|nr:hypothetical protein B0H19DRAFT_90735 [Mycena capillaripes]